MTPRSAGTCAVSAMSTVTHLNPDALPRNPAFSHAVVVENPTRMISSAARTRSLPTARSTATTSPPDPAALPNLELVLTAAEATPAG
jgi:hypothetical protein